MSFILVIVLMLSLVACSGKPEQQTSVEQPAQQTSDEQQNANDFTEINSQNETKSEATKDTIKIALQRNITDLSGSSGGNATYGLVYSIFDTLVRFDPDTMELLPCLATSWEQANEYTWRFTLREGVKFTNGEDFNAQSAAYAINYLADPDFNYQNYKQWSKSWPPSAEVESEYSILVTTPYTNLSVPKLLTRFAMIPMEASKAEDFWSHPIGTGPYVLTSWEPGIRLTLDANENYWNGCPAIAHQIYDIVTDSTARAALIETGEYDFVCDVPLNYTLQLLKKNDTPMNILKTPHTGAWVVYFNGLSTNSFIQDVRFRTALLYAIDQDAICEYVLGGIVQSAQGIGPMYIDGAYDAGGYPARDIEKAKELAAECGYNGEEIKLMIGGSPFNSSDEVVDEILIEMKEAGFNVVPEEVDSATWSKYKKTGDFDLGLNFFGGPYTGDVEQNYTQGIAGCYWSYEEANALLDEIYTPGITEARRLECLKEIMKISWENVPYLFQSESCGMWAINPNLKGVEIFQNVQVSFNNAYFE